MCKWKTPVELTLEGAGHQTVHGPYAAAMLLMISWPTQNGVERERAERLCLEAVEQKTKAAMAREAFLAAIEEAGLTIDNPGTNPLAA